MEEKDYKAIAEIMKEGNVLNINKQTIFIISHNLADYFEREENKRIENINQQQNKDNLFVEIKSIFNKQQFLKDTGVSNE